MISQTYDLNLIPSQIPVTVHCSQYDDGSRTFVFNLYEGASAFELPAGASATFSGVKPDGLGFQYACSITGASQVSVDVALQMTAVAGDCPCKVTVYDTDSNVLGSALCVLDVERHPLQDDTVISDSDIPLVQEAVNWAAQFQPSDFVAKNQGVAQAGKVLGIGNDGMVTPVQGGGGGSADTVSYDNTTSGLTATNVQGAIDEVDSTVDDIDSTVDGLASQVSTLIGDTANYYNITDTADTTVDDADYIPFYDTSATAKKKTTWSNIVTKIKSSLASYFGRKFSQSNGKLNLLAEDNTVLDTVTLSPLATNTSYTDTNSIGATNVQSAVDYIVSALEWKLHGTTTGNTHLTYPTKWRELWIVCTGPDTTWQNFQFSLAKPFLSASGRPNSSAIRTGFYVSSSDNAECTIVVSAIDVYISNLRANGSTHTTNSTMRVYYR